MTWTHPTYASVARLLEERTGLSFPPQRQETAEQGMRRAMTRAGITEPTRYQARVAHDAAALDDLIVELTVGETYFFREPAQFAFIRREVFPAIRKLRGPEHRLRLWSAGCASGEEAYSLAILLEEEGLADKAHLLATDISREALVRARQAIYGTWSLRGEGAATAARYLRALEPSARKGSGERKRYVLSDSLRRRVVFEHLNLALDVYPSFATGTWGMDLILCRNVLIYFEREAGRRVARRLYESLAPGGWLITASSDPPLGGEAPFETLVTEAGVFYRRPDGASSSADLPAEDTYTVQPEPVVTPLPAASAILAVPPPAHQSDDLDEARNAFAAGNYVRAAEVTRDLLDNPAAAALYVRSLANLDPSRAAQAAAELAAWHPLTPELHYLHAVLLLDLDRDTEAIRTLRRVLYLDRALATAHFTLGALLSHRGDRAGARRAYRTAYTLCAGRPADEVVPLSDGEHAGRLADAAAAALALLDASEVNR
jgi:chemotaxis protein methyltransferase CheR